MITHFIEKMEDLPETGRFSLPNFSGYKVHYRATAWSYLLSSVGGNSITDGNDEYILNPEVLQRERAKQS